MRQCVLMEKNRTCLTQITESSNLAELYSVQYPLGVFAYLFIIDVFTE